MIGEVFQPFVHGPGRDGGGDDDGQEDEADEVAGEEGDDIGAGGAQHFADSYFLYALLRGEGGEGEEAEAGDEDGDGGEDHDQGRDLSIGLIEIVELFVEEGVIEGLRGGIAFYEGPGGGQHAGRLTGFGPDEEIGEPSLVVVDGQGIDLSVVALE